jgi:SAM-dependent methyltransferase
MAAKTIDYAYGDDFFSYIEEGAAQSAQAIVPLIADLLGVRSVLDVGCGRGVWLQAWRDFGVADVLGVDGAYVDNTRLAIPPDKFVKYDLSKSFNLSRCFDLVQSLEVGEHIAEARADVFVANLASHGDIILFSAAIPGQGGEFHVNEQPYAYWRDKFASQGFRMFDWLRPHIISYSKIEPWYRYNSFLFARGAALDRVPPEFLKSEIALNDPIPSAAPLCWRVRNLILKQLPQPLVHQLAIFKHKLMLTRRAIMRKPRVDKKKKI